MAGSSRWPVCGSPDWVGAFATKRAPTSTRRLCGAQGCGKTTIARWTARLLEARGLRAVALSLDDFYLSHDARQRLAREVHPLLAVHGHIHPYGRHLPERRIKTTRVINVVPARLIDL